MGAVKSNGPGESKRLDDEMDKARRGEVPLITGPGQQVVHRNSGVQQQKIIKRDPPQMGPTIIDARTRPPVQGADPGVAASVIPVRTVVYVEVGGLDSVQVWELCRQYAAAYEGSVYGTHYVVPVRDGRLRSEMEFEEGFLETVNELCEIIDGKIVLKGGAANVQVMRTHVSEEE